MKTQNILDIIKKRVDASARALKMVSTAADERDLPQIARMEQRLEAFRRIEAELILILALEDV